LANLIEGLHRENDTEVFEMERAGHRMEFKLDEVDYRISYLEGIKEYSQQWEKAVFRVDYKDVGEIQAQEPVFQHFLNTKGTNFMHKDVILERKGRSKGPTKDPYNSNMFNKEIERKRVLKVKDYKLPTKQDITQDIKEHNLLFECNFE
jgi:hypothetical protein